MVSPTASTISPDQSYEADPVDMDVLDKPLPELAEIEALLAEFSGTDVN